tara:strand:- start:30 stop:539 length:510 start_codon:yes stop_codon:yes gene_type:complete
MGFLDYPIDLGFWQQDIDVEKVARRLTTDVMDNRERFEKTQEGKIQKKIAQINRLKTEYHTRKRRLDSAKDDAEQAKAQKAFAQTEIAVKEVKKELSDPTEYVSTLFAQETLRKNTAKREIQLLQNSIDAQNKFLEDEKTTTRTTRRKDKLVADITKALEGLKKITESK